MPKPNEKHGCQQPAPPRSWSFFRLVHGLFGDIKLSEQARSVARILPDSDR
jgi:hypothetical protein